MFRLTRLRARSAATIGIAAALVVGGVAAAQSGGSKGGSEGGQQQAGKRPPPPMMGPPLRGLTYGQLHVRTKSGESDVIRLDQGKIVSVDSSSITLEENDGSEVTVAIDENTEVHAGPGRNSSVDDLSEGQRVLICGPEGEAAKSVVVPPKGGRPKGGHRGAPQGGPREGQLPPPPPGAQMGS